MFSPMSTERVINERDTAAYKVFKWRFEVLIPSTFALSEYEVGQMGTLTTGDRKLDAELASQDAHTYRTIAELAKLHAEGCDIRLVNPRKDAPRIFDLVQAFLMEWADELNRGFNIEVETAESRERMALVLKDIELLESFSQAMYPAAKKVMPNALKSSSLAAKLAQLTTLKLRMNPPKPVEAPTLNAEAPSPFTNNLTSVGQDRIRRWASKDLE